eukprot:jgi/Chlat1/3057/Chrsp21S03311
MTKMGTMPVAVALLLLASAWPLGAVSLAAPDEADHDCENTAKPYPVWRGDSRPPLNHRPLIGVLAQPMAPFFPNDTSIIIASYPKFIEAAGARPVPIFPDSTDEELRNIFSAINGLLIPGGGGKPTTGDPVYEIAKKITKMAIAAADNGDWFPIQGTCLGFEFLCAIINEDRDFLERFDADDDPATLNLTAAAWNSHFLRRPVLEKLDREVLAMENHEWGISLESWNANQELSGFFNVLSTSLDTDRKRYVSTIEAFNYPITATQWHPEMNMYNWWWDNVPHSAEAVELAQHVANFLVGEARKSKHAPSSPEQEKDLLIYNWPVATANFNGSLFEYYALKREKKPIVSIPLAAF